MNIHHYISSGIIESYALGLASTSEAAELEELLLTHPVLVDALLDFEAKLEKFAGRNEIPLPNGTMEKIASVL